MWWCLLSAARSSQSGEDDVGGTGIDASGMVSRVAGNSRYDSRVAGGREGVEVAVRRCNDNGGSCSCEAQCVRLAFTLKL